MKKQKDASGAKYVTAPEIFINDDQLPGDALLNFYRSLGWNGEDNVDPTKIRTSKCVYDALYAFIFERVPGPLTVGMFLCNSGPGVDDDIPVGKVKLLKGWTKPEKEEVA